MIEVMDHYYAVQNCLYKDESERFQLVQVSLLSKWLLPVVRKEELGNPLHFNSCLGHQETES